MRLYSRMSEQKRTALLRTAEALAQLNTAWDDTMPSEALETNFSNFDPNT